MYDIFLCSLDVVIVQSQALHDDDDDGDYEDDDDYEGDLIGAIGAPPRPEHWILTRLSERLRHHLPHLALKSAQCLKNLKRAP